MIFSQAGFHNTMTTKLMTCIGKEINLSCKALLKTENTTVIMAKFCISLPLVSS